MSIAVMLNDIQPLLLSTLWLLMYSSLLGRNVDVGSWW
jgi:hypothetical protein